MTTRIIGRVREPSRYYRCDRVNGCDPNTIARYLVETSEGWGICDYCADCAQLAFLDHNGETLRIVGPFQLVQTGGNCTAYHHRDPQGREWLITRHNEPIAPRLGERFEAGVYAEPGADPVELHAGRMPTLEEFTDGG